MLARASRAGAMTGAMANDTGGFSDVTKAVTVFGGNAIEPLQAQFLSLNEWDSREAVRFRSYQLPTNEGN